MLTAKYTLKSAAEAFDPYLEELGKKPSTIGTSRRALDLFVAHLGEDKELAKLLPVHVGQFFKSEPATTHHGKPRAEASVKQIRRVVRQFLIWCAEQGWIEKAPLPKAEAGGGVRLPVEVEV